MNTEFQKNFSRLNKKNISLRNICRPFSKKLIKDLRIFLFSAPDPAEWVFFVYLGEADLRMKKINLLVGYNWESP